MWPKAPRKPRKLKGGHPGPKPRVGGDPQYMYATEVAELLGTTSEHLLAHRREDFAWLPLPAVHYSGGLAVDEVRWPREATEIACRAGRPKYKRGWHPLPDVHPPVFVMVASRVQRPTRVFFDQWPDFTDKSEWLTSIETQIHAAFGHLCYIDTPAPAELGAWPLMPAIL